MAESRLHTPKLPKMHKPMKTKATDQAKAKGSPQQDSPQQNLPLEPEVVVVPPNQVTDLALPYPQDLPTPYPPVHILDPAAPPPPPITPVHVPNPVQLEIPPVHVPDPVQLQIPPAHVPNPVQPQNPPKQVPNPMLPPAPPVQKPQLNWSYFKPEFSGKAEEDAEAHLLRTNDWMETHNFQR